MREEYRQRLATEYRFAADRMQKVSQAPRKLYFFSVFFGEAQRVLNWEWDRDLLLIYTLTHHVHMGLTSQSPLLGTLLPVDSTQVYERLVQIASSLAAYYENPHGRGKTSELHEILSDLAQIAYAVGGNGSYLYDKGILKL